MLISELPELSETAGSSGTPKHDVAVPKYPAVSGNSGHSEILASAVQAKGSTAWISELPELAEAAGSNETTKKHGAAVLSLLSRRQ